MPKTAPFCVTSIATFFVLSAMLSACSGKEPRKELPSAAGSMDSPGAAPVSKATQSDLAAELDEAELRGTWLEVRNRWQGRRLRWRVTRYPALCRTEERCNVAPFPVQRPARQGWMPEVKFADGAFADVVRVCGDSDCEIEIEGVLAELDVSGENATKLRIENVTLVGTPQPLAR